MSELKKIEALAKLHVSNPQEMEKRLNAVLEYVRQLKQSKFDADPVEDAHVMDISGRDEKSQSKFIYDSKTLKTNCPQLEDDQVVVPQFIDRT